MFYKRDSIMDLARVASEIKQTHNFTIDLFFISFTHNSNNITRL